MNKADERLYGMKAEVFKALAHPLRLAVIDALRDGPQCVCEIAEAAGAERSNVSRHLGVMVRAGVLASRKQGQMVFYKLRTPCVLNFMQCVEGVVRQRAEEAGAMLRSL